MGKKKGGKKAWKKIDTQEVEDFLEKSTREERQGLAVEGVPDAELFFEDKLGDEDTAAAVKTGQLPRKLAARQKVLRSAAILAGAHSAKPAAKVVPRKHKGSVLQQEQRAKQQQQQQQKPAGGGGGGGSARKRGGAAAAKQAGLDLWGDGADAQQGEADAWVVNGVAAPLPPPPKRAKRAGSKAVTAAPSAAAVAAARRPVIPAVEVDPAGCSYNPDVELHQEAVAVAVAVETRKLLDKDLQPLAPPRVVDYQPETDELALLQTLDGGAEDEDAAAEAEEGDGWEVDAAGLEAARRRQEDARKTRKDRNREQRRREAEEALTEQRKLKQQRHELSSLKQIERELAAEQDAKEDALLRRQLDKAERLAAEPPKLSKHKFQPMPLQVLTSDELGGSLRRLKPTAMLAKDRYKSLQKRALIEPRRKIEQKKQGKKVEYIHGERAERAAERQAELQQMREAKKKQKKAAKKATS